MSATDTTRPTPLPVFAEGIPTALKQTPRWMGWRYELVESRWTKVPIAVATGHVGSVTDPATHCPFETALAAYNSPKAALDGIAIVLDGSDGLVGMDFDHCGDLNGETFEIDAEILVMIEGIDSYTERSPGGHGVRIIAFGTLPPKGRKKGPIEMYDDRRMLTITGHSIGAQNEPVTRTKAILDLHRQVFGQASEQPDHSQAAAPPVDDATVLERARSHPTFLPLWEGCWDGRWPTQSEADFAFCRLLAVWSRDPEQINRLFRQSRLYREKWDRDDYRARTIEAALRGTMPQGDPASEPTDRLMTGAEIRAVYGAAEPLVEDLLMMGDLSVLAAQPGVGKSTLTANLAYSVSRGEPFLGRAVKRGAVIILAFEGVTSTLEVLESLGHDLADPSILFWIGAGNPQDPATWLEAVIGERTPVLVIADTLADFSSSRHGASNSGYEEITGKLGAVYRWAKARRCHFMANHHSTTKRDLDGLDAVLGSTGIVSKPGTVLILKRMHKGSEIRLLVGRKHRETPYDYPATVLAFDRKTKRLTTAGTKAEYTFREAGADIVRMIEERPGRTMLWKDLIAPGVIAARKELKLKALALLTQQPKPGILIESGKAKSRENPLTLTIKPGMARPRDEWRLFSGRLGSQLAGTKSTASNSAEEKAS